MVNRSWQKSPMQQISGNYLVNFGLFKPYGKQKSWFSDKELDSKRRKTSQKMEFTYIYQEKPDWNIDQKTF